MLKFRLFHSVADNYFKNSIVSQTLKRWMQILAHRSNQRNFNIQLQMNKLSNGFKRLVRNTLFITKEKRYRFLGQIKLLLKGFHMLRMFQIRGQILKHKRNKLREFIKKRYFKKFKVAIN